MSSIQFLLNANDIVQGNIAYLVVIGGLYGLFDLVPCRRVVDNVAEPTCQFLAATVAGIDPNEVQPQ